MNTPSNIIEVTRVAYCQRMDVGPRIFKNIDHWLAFERHVYSTLDNLSKDYDGGYWEFFILSNGGFYMAPDATKPLHIGPLENYFEGDVSPEASGIIACLYALSHLSFQYQAAGEFGELYHLLYDLVYDHPEGQLIMGAIN